MTVRMSCLFRKGEAQGTIRFSGRVSLPAPGQRLVAWTVCYLAMLLLSRPLRSSSSWLVTTPVTPGTLRAMVRAR